jgi:hypothetical protein
VTPNADAIAADEARRAYARQLAADAIRRGDATGWFETLYAAAEQRSRSAHHGRPRTER